MSIFESIQRIKFGAFEGKSSQGFLNDNPSSVYGFLGQVSIELVSYGIRVKRLGYIRLI